MRGIPEDKAVEIGEQIDSCKYLECSVKEWLRDECQELQEPWMTLEEFLKSGFEGKCWIAFKDKTVSDSIFAEGQFFESEVDSDGYRESFRMKNITHVQPIHKPEPPR